MIIFKQIFLYNRPNMEINKLFSNQPGEVSPTANQY